jgi:hypothetical protein
MLRIDPSVAARNNVTQCCFCLCDRCRNRWDCENLLGGADAVICVGKADISDLVALCLDRGRSAR